MNWFNKGIMKKDVIEEAVIVTGLIVVQFVIAGNSVLSKYLMSFGLNTFTLIVFSTSATFLVLSPICFLLERKQWPRRLPMKLMVQLVLISFSGVTLFQSLILQGLKMTSPAIATAMPNLAPGFIFAIAWAFRLEKVRTNCLYSKVKIVGCLYLVAAVFVLSSNIVLQALTLGDFPAPMSLCAITSLIGVIITMLVELGQNRKFDIGWSGLGVGNLIGYSTLAGTVSGICLSFNGWAMGKRGPVIVSMFSPISTVISVVLSVVTLGETISVGSLAGMFLMFTGLYFVLWAKGKEGYL
ncbi:hypothetical protein Droror1_Dr00000056 [Drosera rotundifolia]